METLEKMTLSDIVANASLFNLMLQCFTNQADCNSLLFVKAVDKYKQESTKYIANALLIQQRYLLNGAYCELGLSIEQRKPTNQLLEEYETRENEIGPTTFDELVKLVRRKLKKPIFDGMQTEEWTSSINDQKKRKRLADNLSQLELF